MTAERKAHIEGAIARAQRTLADLGKSLSTDPPKPLAKRIAAMVGEAITGELAKLTAVAGAPLHPMQKATGTAATAEAFSPEMLEKISATVGFPVDAAMAKAALAEDTPVGRFLAVRGLRLEDPADALPVDLLKALGVDPAAQEDRLTKAAAARDERLLKGQAATTAAFFSRLGQDAARHEKWARDRGFTQEAEMAKAAGETVKTLPEVLAEISRNPFRIGPTSPQVREDRRAALREMRDKQREFGNFAGAAMTNQDLLKEELRIAGATPSFVHFGGSATTTTPLT